MRAKPIPPESLDGTVKTFTDFYVLDRLVVRECSNLPVSDRASLLSLTPGCFGMEEPLRSEIDWKLVKGGLLYASNLLAAAHSIFQEVDSQEGAYWHGMLHRREGDFDNARYWLRRAGRVEGISLMTGFSPVSFVSECEEADRKGLCPAHLLETQRMEWLSMLVWSVRRLKTVS
jgi:hypothetical protein